MNNQEMNSIKESSTKTFSAMAKDIYIMGIYKEQEEYNLLASIMLDKDRTESIPYMLKNIWQNALMNIWNNQVRMKD